MTRALFGIGLSLYVALATGEAALIASRACAEACTDDDTSGNCAPSCDDCLRCAHVRPLAVTHRIEVDILAVYFAPLEQTQKTPSVPEPAEILHVPIA